MGPARRFNEIMARFSTRDGLVSFGFWLFDDRVEQPHRGSAPKKARPRHPSVCGGRDRQTSAQKQAAAETMDGQPIYDASEGEETTSLLPQQQRRARRLPPPRVTMWSERTSGKTMTTWRGGS